MKMAEFDVLIWTELGSGTLDSSGSIHHAAFFFLNHIKALCKSS